jgi:hypothetical protein
VKTVLRYDDRGELRSPTITSQGFWRGEGRVGRAGIYEYRNDDGSIRRELRPREEIQSPEALASFDAAPVTIGHPSDEEVTAENVRRHEVGTVSGPAWADGNHVAATIVIKDARAIKLVKAGKQELSPGYRIKLDETPGADRRYAYPGNPEGRWDAIQRGHRVNHQAIVDRARGGSTVRLRMDSLEQRADGGKLTTAVDGHQHLVDRCGYDGRQIASGTTTWAVSEGAEHGHSHDWVCGADGKVTIALSDGHTHEILDENPMPVTLAPARADAEIDRLGRHAESGSMDKDEQIRSLKAQLADAVAKLAPIETSATQATSRADAADATVVTLRAENGELRAQIAAAAQVVETEAIKRERIRADEAETTIRRLDAERDDAIQARAELERQVAIVVPDLKMRGLPDRQIIATAVKRLDAQQDTSAKVSDAYLRGRFDSLIELHARNARSTQRVADIITETNAQRADSIDEQRAAYRAQGTEPLPNSREAQRAAGRA